MIFCLEFADTAHVPPAPHGLQESKIPGEPTYANSLNFNRVIIALTNMR